MTLLLIVLAVVIFGFVLVYNSLVGARGQAQNAWAQIDVQLKRRFDLIPNLVETAKAYLKHEQGTLEAVMKARSAAMTSMQSPTLNASTVKHAQAFEGALGKLMAVVEGYPELKADANMRHLTEELVSTENRIGFSRQAYNDGATAYKIALQSFPNNLVAKLFSFSELPLWEMEDKAERHNPRVSF